jgi:hypothetical protein
MKKLTLTTLNRVPLIPGPIRMAGYYSLCDPKICQPVIDPTCPPNLETGYPMSEHC